MNQTTFITILVVVALALVGGYFFLNQEMGSVTITTPTPKKTVTSTSGVIPPSTPPAVSPEVTTPAAPVPADFESK